MRTRNNLNLILLTDSSCTMENEIKSSDETENFTKKKIDFVYEKHNFQLSESLKQQLKEAFPSVLEILLVLQKLVENQHTKIKKLKKRLKKSKSIFDVTTQTEDSVTTHAEPISKTISEDIKEAAESAVKNTGFVYEETSGLYYDYNSGYYYNAELGLYYDGNTGTYLKYNQETNTYDFHTQVQSVSKSASETNRTNSKGSKRKRIEHSDDEEAKDIEEGECSDSSSCDEELNHHDVAKAWPPCMRIVVKSTELVKVKPGTLYLITCDGGSLGREGDHSILIPDINISKDHLKIAFNETSGNYEVVDLGSRNGTFLNGTRISSSKQESEPTTILHGTEIKVGSTILICHVHSGNETCNECEPGLLQVEEIKKTAVIPKKSDQHKQELRKLRKKFGIDWASENSQKLAKGYTDRAHIRRQTVGSHNEHEKTQVASTNESINSENKGFKLLSKMGWSEGQSLGKEGTGILKPVELVTTVGTTGIGYTGASSDSLANKSEKVSVWEKTQKRYNESVAISLNEKEEEECGES